MERKNANPRTSLENKYLAQRIQQAVCTATSKRPRAKHHQSLTSIEKRIIGTVATPKKHNFSEQIIKTESKEAIFNRVFQFLTNIINKKSSKCFHKFMESLNFEDKQPKSQLSNYLLKSPENTISGDILSRPLIPSIQQIKKKKKISINSFQSLFSSDSLLSITSAELNVDFISDYKLTLESIQLIYDTPSPFLVIQSLCLIMKYLWKTKEQLTKQNVIKLLAISAILSYKLLYDQEINGIHSHFGGLMDFEPREINQLEAKFLKDVDFELDITNMQYYLLSEKLLLNKRT